MWIEELVIQATNLLETDSNEVDKRVDALLESSDLVISTTDWVQLPTSARAEQTLARCLINLNNTRSSLPPIQVEKAIVWAQDKAGFGFAEGQMEGIRQALLSKVSILTGGPGTGKTTILRALVSILKAKKAKVLLAAPTGRAARRMARCFPFRPNRSSTA